MVDEQLVIEGIVTTLNPQGELNIAPMGPQVNRSYTRMRLRPFKTSQTYQNLCACPEGVFHIVDDVVLLAQAAVGLIAPLPSVIPSDHVRGCILSDACRYFAFRVLHIDDSADRAEVDVSIVYEGRQRDHFGFNRAMYAVVEASILATRLKLLSQEQIELELVRLKPLVDKTGGEREQAAFQFLLDHMAGHWISMKEPRQ